MSGKVVLVAVVCIAGAYFCVTKGWIRIEDGTLHAGRPVPSKEPAVANAVPPATPSPTVASAPVSVAPKAVVSPPPTIVSAKATPTSPVPSAPKLAPPGVLFLLEAVVITHADGVTELHPGTRVQLIGEKAGQVRIKAGTLETSVSPSQVTNDENLAAMARRTDAAGQAALKAESNRQKTMAHKQAVENADRVHQAQQKYAAAARTTQPKPAAVPSSTVNPLDRGAYNQHRAVHSRYYPYYTGRYTYDSRGNRYYVDSYGRWNAAP